MKADAAEPSRQLQAQLACAPQSSLNGSYKVGPVAASESFALARWLFGRRPKRITVAISLRAPKMWGNNQKGHVLPRR